MRILRHETDRYVGICGKVDPSVKHLRPASAANRVSESKRFFLKKDEYRNPKPVHFDENGLGFLGHMVIWMKHADSGDSGLAVQHLGHLTAAKSLPP